MTPDRSIVRLMAVVILAILAHLAPSAVQAHEGHERGGHAHHVPAAATQVRPVPANAVAATAPARPIVPAEAPAWSKPVLRVAAVAPVGDEQCCPGPCRVRCCGTMACCAAGILSGAPGLAPLSFQAARLRPRDVPARAGTGPETPPRPPRTRA
ncbi:hypothetical protein [Methylobacterium sp. 17Sr1-1]|uniref:hypothetical protein n=1 Tax=Methylobacterium sp. 17Sr1-1 TaxID=2202826 RepID=UPI000D6FBC90|nr:hypothetical protein [Methylobacterium sp. 17Sr1-1]AWN55659.1 hypothetical protein DK412_15905 [Methylobacterium sp. 17Sr1-1]